VSELAASPPIAARPRLWAWLFERGWLLGWFALSRAVIVACAAAVHVAGWPRGYFKTAEFGHWLGVLGGWDGRWYREVAAHGYLLVPGSKSDPAFFPLYPLMLKGGALLGVSMSGAGIFLSNVFFLGGTLAFYELTRQAAGSAFARRAAIYVLIFPFSFVFSMVYPTSFVFASTAFAALLAARRRWLLAGLVVACSTLARPEGMFVAIPMLALLRRQWDTLRPESRGTALGAIAAGPAALLAYPAFLSWALHDPLAWSEAQGAWGRHFSPLGIVGAAAHFTSQEASHPWLIRDLLALVAYLGLLAVARRRGLSSAWTLSGLLMIVLPLASGTVESVARFGLCAFALYWGLAELTRKRRFDFVLRGVSFALLVWWTIALPQINP